MKTPIDKKRVEEIFARGTVVDILPSKAEFIEKLVKGEKIKIYIGVDPTGVALHLGHAKNIMFLEDLRAIGLEVILLFGDFTAQVGDPTGKSSARNQLDAEQVKANCEKWLDQVKPILNFDDEHNPAQVMYNSTWLSKLTFAETVKLAANFTVQQMIERDMFEKRIESGDPIHLHEFLYPLMQGYDSVAMDVDAELCGTDQIFNALAGRTLLKKLKNKDKFVVALNLIANPKTGELMSKSAGKGVFINLSANEMFGAIMSQPDEMMEQFYVNCTRLPLSEKDTLMALGPREAKARIAFDIVKRFHSEDKATLAEKTFNETFSKGGVPENIQEVTVPSGHSLAEALIKAGVIESKTEWRRLVEDGAVRGEDDEKITESNFMPEQDTVLKIGKRRFVKVVIV